MENLISEDMRDKSLEMTLPSYASDTSEFTTLVQTCKPLASVGIGCFYRKLVPVELPDYRDHLLRLTLPDRQSRFHCAITPLTIAEHCSKLDWFKTIVIGFFMDGVLRGAVELCASSPQWLDGVELAVSVEGTLQNGGVGTELVRRALVVAQNRSLRHVTLICLIHNRRMQKIVRKLHGRLDFDVTDVLGDIELPQPTQLSLLQEMIDDGAAAYERPQPYWSVPYPILPSSTAAPNERCGSAPPTEIPLAA